MYQAGSVVFLTVLAAVMVGATGAGVAGGAQEALQPTGLAHPGPVKTVASGDSASGYGDATLLLAAGPTSEQTTPKDEEKKKWEKLDPQEKSERLRNEISDLMKVEREAEEKAKKEAAEKLEKEIISRRGLRAITPQVVQEAAETVRKTEEEERAFVPPTSVPLTFEEQMELEKERAVRRFESEQSLEVERELRDLLIGPR